MPAAAGRQGAARQIRRGRARVIGPVAQVGGQHHLGLGPARDVRSADPLALVVIGHAALLAAVDLHIGGVQVDGDRPLGQRRRPRRGRHFQHPPGHRRQAGLHHLPLRGSEPAGQARGGSRTQPRHRRDLLPGRISTLPVQPHQEVLPGQLRRGQPRKQLSGPESAVPLLDRTDRLSSALITPSRSHSSVMTARPAFAVSDRSAGADPRLLPAFARSAAYPFHQVGASPPGMIIISQRSSSQVRAAPIGVCAAVSPNYSRIRVRVVTCPGGLVCLRWSLAPSGH